MRFPYIERSAGALFVAAVTTIATIAPASARPAGAPALRLLSRQPIAVRGHSFHAGERVRIRLRVPAAGLERTRLVSADAGGSFTVRFRASAGKCTAFSVVAIGAAGSSARLKILPLPACLPA